MRAGHEVCVISVVRSQRTTLESSPRMGYRRATASGHTPFDSPERAGSNGLPPEPIGRPVIELA